jgi:hypothetical protein
MFDYFLRPIKHNLGTPQPIFYELGKPYEFISLRSSDPGACAFGVLPVSVEFPSYHFRMALASNTTCGSLHYFNLLRTGHHDFRRILVFLYQPGYPHFFLEIIFQTRFRKTVVFHISIAHTFLKGCVPIPIFIIHYLNGS